MQHSKSHKTKYKLPKLEETFWAYFAGIVDGEGHIRLFKVRETSVGPNYGVELQIAQSKENRGREMFSLFKNKLGVGTIVVKKNRDKTNILCYSIKQRLALKEIIKKIYPYLITKKQQADTFLDFMRRTY
jgi:hypothetical protein